MGQNVSETASSHGENQWFGADEEEPTAEAALARDNPGAASRIAVYATGRGHTVSLTSRDDAERTRFSSLEQLDVTVAPGATETDELEVSSIQFTDFRFGTADSVVASRALTDLGEGR
jgi:hypothetical protein